MMEMTEKTNKDLRQLNLIAYLLNHRFPVTRGVLAEECSDLLRSFFRDIRAKKKAARRARRDRDSSSG